MVSLVVFYLLYLSVKRIKKERIISKYSFQSALTSFFKESKNFKESIEIGPVPIKRSKQRFRHILPLIGGNG